jgi:hypothetical protein
MPRFRGSDLWMAKEISWIKHIVRSYLIDILGNATILRLPDQFLERFDSATGAPENKSSSSEYPALLLYAA